MTLDELRNTEYVESKMSGLVYRKIHVSRMTDTCILQLLDANNQAIGPIWTLTLTGVLNRFKPAEVEI